MKDKLEKSVFDYLNMKTEERLKYFISSRKEISHLPSYWFNFNNVRRNVSRYDSPELHSLTFLIGKKPEDVRNFFREKPDMLLLVPYLLGIRGTAFKNDPQDKILEVRDIDGTYELNFTKIDKSKIDRYLDFVEESELSWLLTSGIQMSSYDYAVGVEAGMDSNGRKNRSGNEGEAYLALALRDISERTEYEQRGQTTSEDIKKLYNIELTGRLAEKRFDGILYDRKRKKLYLFEVNNFNSSGSKIKSIGAEFERLGADVAKTYHEFFYITDGKGWDRHEPELRSAIENINKVFNYKMIESGYLKDLIS